MEVRGGERRGKGRDKREGGGHHITRRKIMFRTTHGKEEISDTRKC